MNKLIVFSADALVYEDMEYLATLPNFKKYLAGGAGVRKVRSVYPTITYPCHATMSTGVWPDKHGVPGNFELCPGQTSLLPWLWDFKYNKWKDDIFTAAKKAGYQTAAVFWPVTGNHPYIDDLIAECWALNPTDIPEKVYRENGCDAHMMDIVMRNLHGERRLYHPELDAFIVNCACDVIRECSPDVLFVHPANVDAARHDYGLFNDHVRRAIESTDYFIGQLMDAEAEAGVKPEEINFVLVSDHGQMNIRRIINLNVLLAENGLIRTDEKGRFLDWDAWSVSGGMSANVYLKHPDDKKMYKKVYNILKYACSRERETYGISRVLTREDFKKEHIDGPFSFMLEADWDNSFGDGYAGPLSRDFTSSDYRYGHATHGYLPEKGPQPTFWAKGPGFRKNVILENASLVDEAPTFARLLGVELKKTDGRCLDELLR